MIKFILQTSLLLFLTLSACKTLNTKFDEFYWGRLENEVNYLYQNNDINSVTDGELNPGSILLFGNVTGDFQEVYVNSSKKRRKKYYLHKPQHVKLGQFKSGISEYIIKSSGSIVRNYVTGEKGGCYYINSNGNRVYVERSLCNGTSYNSFSSGSKKSYSSGGSTYVKGHYRTTKSGNRVYVKPHTRRN